MSDLLKNFIDRMGQSTFCYAREGGQGFVLKTKCQCSCNQTLDCQAYIDKNNFHSYFKGIPTEKMPVYRERIVKEIKDEFKDSQWWRNNVEE